jgi:GPH family glycoside/pentoside/hexuronide:cation symporter
MAINDSSDNSSVSMSRSLDSEPAAVKHYETAPEDRISLAHKLIYGLGAFVNNLLAAAIGGMAIVLNLGLGMNPALVGMLGALPRLTDALTDPLMGYISDNTRSRWGRRRPYIFVGAILSGIVFAMLWQLPLGQSESFYFWYFLIGSFIFYLGYTIFATPWVALGYELTPDYHERTRLMGVQNFMGQLAYIVAPWFLLIMQAEMFDGMVDGASYLAIAIGALAIAVGVMPAIFLRERFSHPELTEEEIAEKLIRKPFWESVNKNMMDFFTAFALTLKVRPFLLLCAATFLVFNGFMLISSFQFYVIIYYVFGGNTELGAEYAGWSGTVGAISTFIVIGIVTWMSSRFGKRKAFFIAIGISIVGYFLKWFCYNPEIPWLLLLPAPLMAFGLGGLFTLMGSMIADVCDYDELNTHSRREGMFGSIYWWVVKLGMALALAGGGFLLNATGFDVALEGNQGEQTIFMMRLFDVGVPILTSLLAMWAVSCFPITEERAHEIRIELEQRRGTASPDASPA